MVFHWFPQVSVVLPIEDALPGWSFAGVVVGVGPGRWSREEDGGVLHCGLTCKLQNVGPKKTSIFVSKPGLSYVSVLSFTDVNLMCLWLYDISIWLHSLIGWYWLYKSTSSGRGTHCNQCRKQYANAKFQLMLKWDSTIDLIEVLGISKGRQLRKARRRDRKRCMGRNIQNNLIWSHVTHQNADVAWVCAGVYMYIYNYTFDHKLWIKILLLWINYRYYVYKLWQINFTGSVAWWFQLRFMFKNGRMIPNDCW